MTTQKIDELRKQRSFGTRLARATGLVALLGSAAAGCGGPVDTEAGDEPVGTAQQELYGNRRYWPKAADGITYIPVCWQFSGYDADKQSVRSAVEGGWAAASSIKFTGWGSCTAADQSARVLRIRQSDETPHSGLGSSSSGVDMVLNFTYSNWDSYTSVNCRCRSSSDPLCAFHSETCDYCSDNHEFCDGLIALHEFGHALGFYHEQVRPENADGHLCDEWQDGERAVPGGDALTPGFDRSSIMSYCSQWDRSSATLSDGDVAGVRAAYGDKPSHLPYQIILYKDPGYGGQSQALYLSTGSYDLDDLDIGNDTLSSLRIPSGWTATLYRDSHFRGDSVTLSGDTGDLGAIGWNDEASSIRITGVSQPHVTAYADADYGGASQILHPGVYNVGDLGIGNDTISSMRVPSGWQVLLYEDSGFSGDRKLLTGDTSYVGGDFNDRTSSVMIQGPADRTPVMVFSDRQYGGAGQALWPGRYTGGSLRIGNDRLSSLVVPAGWRVTLYRDSNFQGASVTFTSSRYTVGDFDDETSSIIVEGP